MNRSNKKIIKSLNEKGYYVYENFFNKQKLKKVKQSLVRILQYIHPDNETDLQKNTIKLRNSIQN